MRNASVSGLLAGMGLIGLTLASCDAGRTQGEHTPPREMSSGHREMLEQLQRAAEGVIESDAPYVGRAQVATLRRMLDELPPDRPDARRLQYHLGLGRHLLRLGEIDEGVAQHERAYELLEQHRAEMAPERAVEVVFELAVAYLRKGESDNCVLRHTADSCLLPIEGGGVHVNQEGSTAAIPHLVRILENTTPNSRWHVRSRWLLNIVYMTLGRYPQEVPAAWLIPPAAFDSAELFPRFRDVAPALGLNAFDLSGGAIAEDFDGDGHLDLMVSTLDPRGQMRYFRNDGRGGFTERTEPAGLQGLVGGLNLVHADYDNDGDADLLVLRGGWFRKMGDVPNSLLRNEGDGTFADVTFEAGLGEVHYPTQTADWADYDNDGDLDLYIGNETDDEMSAPCQLFRNDGDGHFTDVAAEAGVENGRYTKGVAWGDIDGDGLPDLYVSNLGQPNRLYRNAGDGTFRDIATEAGVDGPRESFPVWFWDFDNDGQLDLYVSGYSGDIADVAASYLGLAPLIEPARLYRGDGRGGFTDVAAEQGLIRTTMPMGANFGDLDNDGWPDFYLGTGYPSYEALMPNLMYRNRGGAGFADVTTSGGFGHLQKGHAVVFADLDNDGDQDLFEQLGGAYPGDAFGNALFENPGFDHHWIKISLVGERSNRSGIGARIRIEITENGRSRTIHHGVGTGGSFGSNPLRQEIGLGGATRIDRLEVFWPASGETQRFTDIAADQWIEIGEGQRTLHRLKLEPAAFGS